MCDQTEVAYLPGDVVWVKLGKLWWPGKVIAENEINGDITKNLKSLVAVVKFFQEDTYEFVKNLSNIYHYNCLRKVEFIKKGINTLRSNNRSLPSNLKLFPLDVANAEVLTGGNPDILNDDVFLPEEKVDYKDLFPTSKKTPKKMRLSEPNKKRESPVPLQTVTTRPITHPRFIKSSLGLKTDYHSKILLQAPMLTEFQTPHESPKTFNCLTCEFTTTRINVLIMHIKSHSNDEKFVKKKIKKKDIVKEKLTTSDKNKMTSDKSKMTSDKNKTKPSPNTTVPNEPKKRKSDVISSPKKKLINLMDNNHNNRSKKVPKRNKRNMSSKKSRTGDDDLPDSLLEDWVEYEELVQEQSGMVGNSLQNKIEYANKCKKLENKMSCFDFVDAEEDSIVDPSKIYKRKIPRQLGDRKISAEKKLTASESKPTSSGDKNISVEHDAAGPEASLVNTDALEQVDENILNKSELMIVSLEDAAKITDNVEKTGEDDLSEIKISDKKTEVIKKVKDEVARENTSEQGININCEGQELMRTCMDDKIIEDLKKFTDESSIEHLNIFINKMGDKDVNKLAPDKPIKKSADVQEVTKKDSTDIITDELATEMTDSNRIDADQAEQNTLSSEDVDSSVRNLKSCLADNTEYNSNEASALTSCNIVPENNQYEEEVDVLLEKGNSNIAEIDQGIQRHDFNKSVIVTNESVICANESQKIVEDVVEEFADEKGIVKENISNFEESGVSSDANIVHQCDENLSNASSEEYNNLTNTSNRVFEEIKECPENEITSQEGYVDEEDNQHETANDDANENVEYCREISNDNVVIETEANNIQLDESNIECAHVSIEDRYEPREQDGEVVSQDENEGTLVNFCKRGDIHDTGQLKSYIHHLHESAVIHDNVVKQNDDSNEECSISPSNNEQINEPKNNTHNFMNDEINEFDNNSIIDSNCNGDREQYDVNNITEKSYDNISNSDQFVETDIKIQKGTEQENIIKNNTGSDTDESNNNSFNTSPETSVTENRNIITSSYNEEEVKENNAETVCSKILKVNMSPEYMYNENSFENDASVTGSNEQVLQSSPKMEVDNLNNEIIGNFQENLHSDDEECSVQSSQPLKLDDKCLLISSHITDRLTTETNSEQIITKDECIDDIVANNISENVCNKNNESVTVNSDVFEIDKDTSFQDEPRCEEIIVNNLDLDDSFYISSEPSVPENRNIIISSCNEEIGEYNVKNACSAILESNKIPVYLQNENTLKNDAPVTVNNEQFPQMKVSYSNNEILGNFSENFHNENIEESSGQIKIYDKSIISSQSTDHLTAETDSDDEIITQNSRIVRDEYTNNGVVNDISENVCDKNNERVIRNSEECKMDKDTSFQNEVQHEKIIVNNSDLDDPFYVSSEPSVSKNRSIIRDFSDPEVVNKNNATSIATGFPPNTIIIQSIRQLKVNEEIKMCSYGDGTVSSNTTETVNAANTSSFKNGTYFENNHREVGNKESDLDDHQILPRQNYELNIDTNRKSLNLTENDNVQEFLIKSKNDNETCPVNDSGLKMNLDMTDEQGMLDNIFRSESEIYSGQDNIVNKNSCKLDTTLKYNYGGNSSFEQVSLQLPYNEVQNRSNKEREQREEIIKEIKRSIEGPSVNIPDTTVSRENVISQVSSTLTNNGAAMYKDVKQNLNFETSINDFDDDDDDFQNDTNMLRKEIDELISQPGSTLRDTNFFNDDDSDIRFEDFLKFDNKVNKQQDAFSNDSNVTKDTNLEFGTKCTKSEATSSQLDFGLNNFSRSYTLDKMNLDINSMPVVIDESSNRNFSFTSECQFNDVVNNSKPVSSQAYNIYQPMKSSPLSHKAPKIANKPKIIKNVPIITSVDNKILDLPMTVGPTKLTFSHEKGDKSVLVKQRMLDKAHVIKNVQPTTNQQNVSFSNAPRMVPSHLITVTDPKTGMQKKYFLNAEQQKLLMSKGKFTPINQVKVTSSSNPTQSLSNSMQSAPATTSLNVIKRNVSSSIIQPNMSHHHHHNTISSSISLTPSTSNISEQQPSSTQNSNLLRTPRCIINRPPPPTTNVIKTIVTVPENRSNFVPSVVLQIPKCSIGQYKIERPLDIAQYKNCNNPISSYTSGSMNVLQKSLTDSNSLVKLQRISSQIPNKQLKSVMSSSIYPTSGVGTPAGNVLLLQQQKIQKSPYHFASTSGNLSDASNSMSNLSLNMAKTSQPEIMLLTMDNSQSLNNASSMILNQQDENNADRLFFNMDTAQSVNIPYSVVNTNDFCKTTKQDILAKALENTDVLRNDMYLSDVPNPGNTIIFGDYNNGRTRTTNLALPQHPPIMSPLEVSSSIVNQSVVTNLQRNAALNSNRTFGP